MPTEMVSWRKITPIRCAVLGHFLAPAEGANNGMLSGAVLTSLYFWSKRGAAYESQSQIGPIYNFISCQAANFIHDHLSACRRV